MKTPLYFTNRYFISLLLVSLVALSQFANAQKVVVQVVAVVNNIPIMSSDVQRKMRSVIEKNKGANLKLSQAMYTATLEFLVAESLQKQRIKNLGITIPDEQVDQVISNLRADHGNVTKDQLLVAINELSLKDLKANIKFETGVLQGIAQDFASELVIKQDEIDHIIRRFATNIQGNEYLLEYAVFAETDKDKAQKLSDQRVSTFSIVAKDGSLNPDEISLGWLVEQQIPDSYLEELKNMEVGETSKPINLPNGIHVIHLVDFRTVLAGQSSSRSVRIRLLELPDDADKDDVQTAIRDINLGKKSFDEVVIKLKAQIKIVSLFEGALPQAVKDNMLVRQGEVAGPYEIDGTNAIVQILSIEDVEFGDDELRQQATAMAADDNFAKLRARWIENLRSVGTVEIIRANL